jgi:nicotinate-nucleotide adenylyltransferase
VASANPGSAKKSVARWGVFGGTFDPIHLGHLAAAEEAREQLGLVKVLFVPSGQPPHKPAAGLSAAAHRYAMTELAVAGNPHFAVSRVEIDRPGPSYTVDTLRLLEGELPEAELYFITGADMLFELSSWKDPDVLLADYHFVAVTRPGWNLRELPPAVRALQARYRERLHIVAAPGVAVSSTELRRRLRRGRSVRYLIPAAVIDYIAAHRLYARREGGRHEPE